MSEQLSDRAGLPGLIDRLKEFVPAQLRRDAAVVPVVRLSGVIGAVTPLRPGMTLAGVAKTLERAFATRHAKAVALVINSPGGSPVQSRQIYLRIRQLAAEKKLPVLVFVEDVAASGGYMIACAGDEIFCDPSSILGSIGVVGGSFRISGTDQEDRRRAAALYGGRAQGDARSVPAGKPRRRRAAEGASARDPRHLHRAGQGKPRRAPEGRRRRAVHRRILGGRDLGVAGPCGRDRRSALDAARALRRQGADAGDRARQRDAGRPAGPQVGRGRARWPRWTVSGACRTN